jgi:hypothetical protein
LNVANDTDTFEAYVTKWALTAGIIKVRGSLWHERYFVTPRRDDSSGMFVGPKDWHLSEGEAMVRASKMIDARLKLLAKSAKKLEAQAKAAAAGTFPVVTKE